MAMYEDQGYCPSNSFVHFKGQTAKNWSVVREILGDRIGYMVYAQNEFNQDEAFVTEMFMASETLGLRVATALEIYIPKCKYAEYGKKILLHDVNNVGKIPSGGGLFTEDEFIVSVKDTEEFVDVYIYKQYGTEGKSELPGD